MPKIVDLNDYVGERALADLISWLDEEGIAEVLHMSLQDYVDDALGSSLPDEAKKVLAPLLLTAACAGVKLTCLAVQDQIRSGQKLDWLEVAAAFTAMVAPPGFKRSEDS